MARTEKEKMLAGEPFVASDPQLVAERAQAHELLRSFNLCGRDEEALRPSLLARLLAAMGDGTVIEPPFRCCYGQNIRIGARGYVNSQCLILDDCPVTIGDEVLIGPNVQLYTVTHALSADARIYGTAMARPITLGSRVWLGGGTIVCPGVTVGEGTTVGAGSVVTRDLPPYVFAAGNPCRVIRTLR
jgi:maltose O-acetyltransferase